MPVKDPKEVFLLLISNVRQGAERGTKIYQEIGQLKVELDWLKKKSGTIR